MGDRPDDDQRFLDRVHRDLLNAQDIADLLGLFNASAVRTYASRSPDFPAPVLPRDPEEWARSDRWWFRRDIEEWREAHPPRARSRDATEDPS